MYPLSLLSRRLLALSLFALVGAFALSACSTAERAADTTADVAEDVGDAVMDAAGASYDAVEDLFDDDDVDAAALVRPTSNGSVQGAVTFDQDDDGVEIEISLRGLAPGEHGFHIHQNASCADDAQAAGGHFDPMNTNNHGSPTDDMMGEKHVGDLGNITADGDGTVETEMMVDGLTLSGANGLVGHAVVVHSGRDDLETDPAGDAGQRVGCGIVTARN